MTQTIWGKLIALGEYPHGANVIEYEVPLGPDVSAFLTVPRNLTRREVQRIQAFLLALVDEPQRSHVVAGGKRADGISNA